MLDWRLVGEGLRLLRDEARFRATTQRRRLQLLLVLVVLSRAWKPWLRKWLLRVHAWRVAAKPLLVYQSTPQNDALLERCPTLRSQYLPPWYLSNGHVQTLYLGAQMRAKHPVIHYEREIVELPDGGIVSLDWALPPSSSRDGAGPRRTELDRTHRTMVILPGLTGGSDEFYIRSLVYEMLAKRWQCVVLNARGCARTPLRTPQLFSCAHTGDLRFVLEMFRGKYAFETLVAVGFSMGSNVLVKYLGEYRDDALVSAAVSVGNPFDMVAASRNLQRSLFYRHTYYAALTQNLKKLFFHRSNAHEAFKNHPTIDLEAVRNATGIDDFDEKLTCIVFGYKDADDYYSDASSSTRIQHVHVPLLCLNAEDDPISAAQMIPFDAIRKNANVILCLTKGGGHLGFYECEEEELSSKSPGPPRIWSSQFAHPDHELAARAAALARRPWPPREAAAAAVAAEARVASAAAPARALGPPRGRGRDAHAALRADARERAPARGLPGAQRRPIAHEQYCPPWYLSSGHLQTFQLTREPPDVFPTVLYERQTLDMPDGGIVSLDWALAARKDGSLPRVSSLDPHTPTLLLLPGLTGGSDEFYIRCAVHEMRARGWQCVVLNARGCARTPLTTAQLFCCAYTDDLRFVLETFHAQYAFSTLVAAGFSMGSNVLVKYLGEYAETPLLTAGVSVGNPFDLVACAAHLKSSAFYRLTYDKALNGNLQQLFFAKSNAHEAFRHDRRIDISAIQAARNLSEFDDRLTRRIFDYESVHAYYADASSITRLARVSVPLLCLNAKDDPISVTLPTDAARKNPRVILCVTKHGGHLGFYEDQGDQDDQDKTVQQSWAARAVAQFAESVYAQQQLLEAMEIV